MSVAAMKWGSFEDDVLSSGVDKHCKRNMMFTQDYHPPAVTFTEHLWQQLIPLWEGTSSPCAGRKPWQNWISVALALDSSPCTACITGKKAFQVGSRESLVLLSAWLSTEAQPHTAVSLQQWDSMAWEANMFLCFGKQTIDAACCKSTKLLFLSLCC